MCEVIVKIVERVARMQKRDIESLIQKEQDNPVDKFLSEVAKVALAETTTREGFLERFYQLIEEKLEEMAKSCK